MKLPDGFPRTVVDEAEWVAEVPALPRLDRTDLPLITLGPAGATDLGQALHLEEPSGGYRVWYAVADVGAFVRPGGAIDTEARLRGETVPMPDGCVPLHPPVLSEAVGLLPGVTRPAVLWCVDLDAEGRTVGVDVTRALVRSRERLDYDYAQTAIDTGTADGTLRLLAEIGRLRIALGRARGGVTPPVLAQEIVPDGNGYLLRSRTPLEAEAWNAQISLLTGMAAASMMLDAEIGLLRVLPPASAEQVAQVREVAAALGVPWPKDAGYDEVVHALDPRIPEQAAFLQKATVLLRGAGYVAFNGEPPSQAEHAAVGAPYAHVTTPLHRLADRYATEICLAIAAGEPVPQDVQEAMAELPEIMHAGGRRLNGVRRACVDLVGAFVLRERVGRTFEAVVIDVAEDQPWGRVRLTDPAMVAPCDGEELRLGRSVLVRLTRADLTTREVRFGLA